MAKWKKASLPVYTKFYEFRYTGLVRDFIPKTLKARSRTILALTSLVSSQKQKPTIVKTVEPQQFLKAVIRGGNRRTFFVSLVDTR